MKVPADSPASEESVRLAEESVRVGEESVRVGEAPLQALDPAAAPRSALPEPRAALVAEVGDAAAALPLDLVDVVAHAWRAFRRGRDP